MTRSVIDTSKPIAISGNVSRSSPRDTTRKRAWNAKTAPWPTCDRVLRYRAKCYVLTRCQACLLTNVSSLLVVQRNEPEYMLTVTRKYRAVLRQTITEATVFPCRPRRRYCKVTDTQRRSSIDKSVRSNRSGNAFDLDQTKFMDPCSC